MMKLYEIDEAILECVDKETGEIIDPEKLDALQMEREAKIEGVALWKKDLDAEAKAIREEEVKLADRRRVLENRANGLKGYLQHALGGQKFSTPRVAISYRKGESVSIYDAEKLPLCYMRQKDPEPDKKFIKEALKAGKEVPGAELVESTSIQIK